MPHKFVGQIDPEHSDLAEDYICAFSLTEFELFLDRSEYLREDECLYRIPIGDIIEFYSPEQRANAAQAKKSWAANFIGFSLLLISGMGFFYRSAEKTDTVLLRFYNDRREQVNLRFRMLGRGVANLIQQYELYARRMGDSGARAGARAKSRG